MPRGNYHSAHSSGGHGGGYTGGHRPGNTAMYRGHHGGGRIGGYSGHNWRGHDGGIRKADWDTGYWINRNRGYGYVPYVNNYMNWGEVIDNPSYNWSGRPTGLTNWYPTYDLDLRPPICNSNECIHCSKVLCNGEFCYCVY